MTRDADRYAELVIASDQASAGAARRRSGGRAGERHVGATGTAQLGDAGFYNSPSDQWWMIARSARSQGDWSRFSSTGRRTAYELNRDGVY